MIDAATDPFALLPPATVTPLITVGVSPAGGYRAILPAPLPETIRHPRHGTPTMLWHYRNANGSLLFAVARFDLLDGGKEVLPFTCGARGWVWKAPPDPRSLYGLEKLATRPGAPVLVVEGEKAADIAAMLFPTHVVLTWQGGCNAVSKAD